MNVISRFFKAHPTQPESNTLGDLQSFGNNIEYRPRSDVSEHLIAHGEVRTGNEPPQEVTTAIRRRGTNAEFSTNMGQVPDNLIGRSLPESLNRQLSGKFITFDSERNKRDLVHVTEKPLDYLDRGSFNSELEHHAKTQVIVNDILDGVNKNSLLGSNLSTDEAFSATQQIVDSKLNLRRNLGGSLGSSRYSPIKQD